MWLYVQACELFPEILNGFDNSQFIIFRGHECNLIFFLLSGTLSVKLHILAASWILRYKLKFSRSKQSYQVVFPVAWKIPSITFLIIQDNGISLSHTYDASNLSLKITFV